MKTPRAAKIKTKMKRPFYLNPKFFLAAAAAFIFFSALVAAAPYLVPSSTCQNWLDENIGKKLGARVTVKKIALKSFPYLGYSIDGLDIVSTTAPFQGLSLAKAGKVSGSLSFAGLMGGKVITSVSASDLTVDLRISDTGTNLAAALGLSGAPGPAGSAETLIPPPPAPATLGAPQPSGQEAEIPAIKALPAEPSTAPQEKPAAEPQSFLNNILIPSAIAEEDGIQSHEDNLEIKSLEVSGGGINIWQDNVRQVAIENIELGAKRLKFSNGAGASFEMRGMLADFAHPTAAGEAFKTSVGATGQIFIDKTMRSVSTKGLALGIAGSHITLDSSIGYSPWPGKIYIHAVSADLSRDACGPVFSFFPEWISKNLSWHGNVALNVLIQGAEEGLEISAGADFGLAKMNYGKFFNKASGLPFKTSFALLLSPDSIVMSRGEGALGESLFKAGGSIERGAAPAIRLNIQGEGLNDTALKIYFPWLAFSDSINGLKVSADATGEIESDAPMEISGTFSAANFKIAGIALSNVEGSFEHTAVPASEPDKSQPPSNVAKHVISFPTLKAAFLGGSVSGNGTASLGETADMSFDVVVDRVDASSLSALGGAVAGSSSMVVKIAGSGQNAEELARNSNLTGTFILKSAAWSKTNPVASLFTAETWSAIETLSGIKLLEAQEKKLAESNSSIEDLSASFEMSGGLLKIGSATWKNPSYVAEAGGEIDPERGVVAAGFISLPKETAALLVPAAAQKLLLDAKGRMSLPASFSGRPPDIAAIFDKTKFKDVIKPRPAKPEVEKKPAKEPPKPAAKILSQKENTPAQKQNPPEARQKRQKTPAAKIPEQSEEDILKVIIGK